MMMIELRDEIIKLFEVKSYKNNFLFNGHLQTIFSAFSDFSNVDLINFNRKLLSLVDGGTISVDVHNDNQNSCEVLVICHGLTGGSHESYVRCLISELHLDMTVVVVNFRGCANTKVTSSLLYSGGQTNDLRSALLFLRNYFPNASFVGLGFSLGANVLTKYIGEEKNNCMLKAGIAIGNPWDLFKGSQALQSNLFSHFVYDRAMANNLRKLMEIHKPAVKDEYSNELNLLDSLVFPTLKDFDNTITRKLGGHPPNFPFNSAEDYYIWLV